MTISTKGNCSIRLVLQDGDGNIVVVLEAVQETIRKGIIKPLLRSNLMFFLQHSLLWTQQARTTVYLL